MSLSPNFFSSLRRQNFSWPMSDSDNPGPAPDLGIHPDYSGAISPTPPHAQPNLQGTSEFQDYMDTGAKLRSALNPVPVSTPRALLGALVSQRNPQLSSIITGDYQRQRAINPLIAQQKILGDQLTMGRQLESERIANAEKEAATGYYQAHADVIKNPPMKPKEESWSIVPNVTGPNGELIEREQNSGQTRYANLPGGAKPSKAQTQTEEDKAISDYLEAHKLPNIAANRDKVRSVLKTRDRKPVDQDLADINKQIKEAALAKAQEPTADEQRRADLARNMNENLDQLEEIANRRPDLFGPVAGRMTQAANVIGTSDPDKAKLKAIKEYLGMASVGAHAMRNAQHVGTAADAVMNGFTNSPEAMKAAIGEARKSTGTFLADEQRRKNRAMAIGGGPSAPATSNSPANDPLGIR